jgi:hypothetical protein
MAKAAFDHYGRNPPPGGGTSKRLLLFVIAFLALGAALRLAIHISAIRNPLELDNGEGIVLMQAKHITDFSVAYRNIDTPPYVAFEYPPLYYLVVRLFLPLTGELLSAGRLTSVICSVVLAGLFALFFSRVLPRRVHGTPRAALILLAGVIPFQLYSMAWASLMRVDTLALLFAFAGLIVFTASARLAPQMAAMVLFVAAFYTKQSTVAAAAACLGICALLNFRRALGLAAFGAALALAFGGLWNVWTHGGFVRNLVFYLVNPFSLMRAAHIASKNFQELGLFLPLPLTMAVMVVGRYLRLGPRSAPARLRASVRRVGMRRALAICTAHFFVSLALTLSVGKVGSNYNYFLEWNLSCCLLAVFLMAIWFGLPHRARRDSWHAAVAALLVLWAVLTPLRAVEQLRITAAQRAEHAMSREHARRIVEQMRAAPGPILTDGMVMLYRAGKDVYAEPAILCNLALAGTWDQSGLIEQIRAHKFPLIVTSLLDDDHMYTPQVRDAIRDAYRLDDRIGGYDLCRPR